MDIVKVRKHGDSIMVTLSSKLAVKGRQKFCYYKDNKSIISLIPKVEDYFENAKVASKMYDIERLKDG